MSSDGFFDDDLDESFLAQVDAIEAAALPPKKTLVPVPVPDVINLADSDDYDATFDIDATDLERLDTFIESSYQEKAAPRLAPGSTNLSRTGSRNALQTTLFGDVLDPGASSSKPASSSRNPQTRTSSSKKIFSAPQRKTKQWDHTEFAKSGWRKRKSKGKERENDEADDNGMAEEEDFQVLLTEQTPGGPPPPMKLQADRLAMRQWIYPLNQPKRDYQFNIVRHCLFDNTLVALPTGLGKTFIAGVVMLNYYLWFPEGKVIFVAPTKPLVAQQIAACHKTCGIPGRDAALLTGEIAKAVRFKKWQEKRVFYMTPQTLINDLAQSTCDPKDIVLLVVDEAHKGTGDYAYAQVVRYLMATNPHFRVLALTATPGGKPEAVQAVVDSLHIGRIEIRNEDSLDLRQYMHKKIMKQHKVSMHEDICKIRDLLAKVMEPTIKKVADVGVLYGNIDPTTLHPFRCTSAMSEVMKRSNKQQLMWTLPALKQLSALARMMGYLIEASVGMCYTSLQETMRDTEEVGRNGKKTPRNPLRNNPAFQAVSTEIEAQRSRGLKPHPKMEALKTLVIQHFGAAMSDGPGDGAFGASRIMVFAAYREVVDEIVEMLNQEQPLIRAIKLIGQGSDKQGNSGQKQKAQQEVLDRFKAGEGNVLVATSIGEEGLDIGEIDMVICYDAQKTPIRMLQRIGRTGRKQDGYVHILMAEGREENNWNKARDAYEDVQQSIVRAEQIELYGDVKRLLPEDITPQCLEQVMDIEEYTPPGTRTGSLAGGGGKSPVLGKGKKRKRNDDLERNMPPGALAGFATVKELLSKQGDKDKKKKKVKAFDPLAALTDDTDAEIEAGVFGQRRSPDAKGKRKKTVRKTSTNGVANEAAKKPPAPRKKKSTQKSQEPEALTFSQKGRDDSDDLEIEMGPLASLRRRPSTPKLATPSPVARSPESPTWWSPTMPAERNSPVNPVASGSKSPIEVSSDDAGMGSLSPERWPTHKRTTTRTPSPGPSRLPLSSPEAQHDASWLLSDDEFVGLTVPPSPPEGNGFHPAAQHDLVDNSVEFVDEDELPRALAATHTSVRARSMSSSPHVRKRPRKMDMDMPPPALPARFTSAASIANHDDPEPSFPVRPAARPGKRPSRLLDALDSSPLRLPSSDRPLQRLQRRRDSLSPSPPPVPVPPRRRSSKPKSAPAAPGPGARRPRNLWVDDEAAHSGSELSAGSSGADDEAPESESDRQFLHALPETQMSPSYAQTQAYRQSLLTQAPGAPRFANGPVRRGRFGPPGQRARLQVSSSPPREDDEPDEYAIGSFVVDDDDDIL